MVKLLIKVVRAQALDGTWPERTNKQVPIQCQGLFPMSLINGPLDQLALIVNVVRTSFYSKNMAMFSSFWKASIALWNLQRNINVGIIRVGTAGASRQSEALWREALLASRQARPHKVFSTKKIICNFLRGASNICKPLPYSHIVQLRGSAPPRA